MTGSPLELLFDIHPEVPGTLTGDPGRLKEDAANLKILVVAEHPMVRALYQNILKTAGHRVTAVASMDSAQNRPNEKTGSLCTGT